MKYKAIIPPNTNFSGNWYIVSDKPMETKEQEALWHYNKSLDHDGIKNATRLPKGTKFIAIQE